MKKECPWEYTALMPSSLCFFHSTQQQASAANIQSLPQFSQKERSHNRSTMWNKPSQPNSSKNTYTHTHTQKKIHTEVWYPIKSYAINSLALVSIFSIILETINFITWNIIPSSNWHSSFNSNFSNGFSLSSWIPNLEGLWWTDFSSL